MSTIDGLYVESDPIGLASRVADDWISLARATLQSKSTFKVALAGGQTPRLLYQAIASHRDLAIIDWTKVEFFWGDERDVPSDHKDSNYHMADEALIGHLPAKPIVQRILTELGPIEAARRYDELLRLTVPLDLILLGMGNDGHTASLFPDTSALDEIHRLAVAVEVKKLSTMRISMTYPAIHSAHQVWILVAGADKAEALAQVFAHPEKYPIGKVHPVQGAARWYTDAAAASRLRSI